MAAETHTNSTSCSRQDTSCRRHAQSSRLQARSSVRQRGSRSVLCSAAAACTISANPSRLILQQRSTVLCGQMCSTDELITGLASSELLIGACAALVLVQMSHTVRASEHRAECEAIETSQCQLLGAHGMHSGRIAGTSPRPSCRCHLCAEAAKWPKVLQGSVHGFKRPVRRSRTVAVGRAQREPFDIGSTYSPAVSTLRAVIALGSRQPCRSLGRSSWACFLQTGGGPAALQV
jgi:hypothetical protein